MAVVMSFMLLHLSLILSRGHALDLMPDSSEFDIGMDTDASLTEIIARLISIVLGFLGIIIVLIILYAGFTWMTAGGDQEKVKTAKQWMINGIIGLVIVTAAWAIASFVTGSIGGAVSGDGGGVY